MALGNRGMTVENDSAFLLGTVFFRTALSCSGGYHLKKGGMPLHNANEINCKRGATTENQGADVKYRAKDCMLMIVCVCVCVCYLT